jgi:hypothetical protein
VVRDVSAGAAHTVCVCVVLVAGKEDVGVYAWGDPANRRLGGVDAKRHAMPQVSAGDPNVGAAGESVPPSRRVVTAPP